MVGFLQFLSAALSHADAKSYFEYRCSSGRFEDLYDLWFVYNCLKNSVLKMRLWRVCLD